MGYADGVHDVVVIGAGPAGAATAGLLASMDFDTVLLDGSRPSLLRPGEFLSPQARALVNRMALLEYEWEMPHRVVRAFHSVWGSQSPVTRQYLFDAQGHALLLDRVCFENQLLAAAKRRGAQIHSSSPVLQAMLRDKEWTLTVQTGTTRSRIKALFLIDCSGRIGAPVTGVPAQRTRIDRLICLGALLQGYSGDPTPAVESYARGWAYSAGIGQDELMINISTEHRPRAGGLPRFFLNELAQCPIAASRVARASPRDASAVHLFSTDIASTVTRPAVGAGWCLAGDRAQSMDPLCSGGIESALKHANCIAAAAHGARTAREIDLASYSAWLERSYSSYLKARSEYYRLEGHRPHRFWQRRGAPSGHPTLAEVPLDKGD